MNDRPARPEDLPAIAALLALEEEQVNGRPSRIGVADVREWMSRTNLAEDSRLYEEDGRLVACGWFDAVDDVGFAVGVVHPEWKGRGLGGGLVDRSEGRAAAHGVARLHQFALGADPAAAGLLEGRGYGEVRRFYDMAIELRDAPEVPAIEIETLREEDARQFHDALDEAFQDHWEHHTTSFEEWWGRHSANANLDLSLWFLVRDGEEIVAVARNEANRNGGGYVGALGVRRPWRGRGYAKALLLRTFREFWDRGVTRITLGVDAQSPTGATQLYERVGMHVEQENVVFEKRVE